MPWVASLDDVGPRNGDVLVRTDKGRMVAVIYAAATQEETMRRAQTLLLADPSLKPVGELTSGEMLSLDPKEREIAAAAILSGGVTCSWCEGDLAPGELCACNTQVSA